jgi:hypothetical protein
MDISYDIKLATKANADDTHTKEETDLRIIEIYPWLMGDPNASNNIRAGPTGLYIYSGMETVMHIHGQVNAATQGTTWFYKDTTFVEDVDIRKTLNGKMIKANGTSGGGNIRCLPTSDATESSIGFYKYMDERAVNPGDMWVVGQGAWTSEGSMFKYR